MIYVGLKYLLCKWGLLRLVLEKHGFGVKIAASLPSKIRKGWCHTHTHARTHAHNTQTFNDPPFSGTTQVSLYQKGKTNLDFTEARDSEWQWHQLGHTQVCTLHQTDNHTSTPPLVFYRPDALPGAQPTVSKHWRQKKDEVNGRFLKLACVLWATFSAFT